MSGSPPKPTLRGNIIADTSIRQPVMVTMLMLLALVTGLLAYTTMPVNQLPDIELPTIVVTVAYPGAGPESVADQVAKPIEDELSTISGVDSITSNSTEGLAVVVAEFRDGIDPNIALQDVREKITSIRQRLPQEVEEPVFQRIQPNQAPILVVAVKSARGITGRDLRELVDEQIVPQIQQVPGVGSTTLSGGQVRQINVEMNLNRLQNLGILPSQVDGAIAAASTNIGLGSALANGQSYNLRTPSAYEQPEDIAKTGIPGSSYTVGDVATVVDGVAEQQSYVRLDGADAVTLEIRKQTSTNTTAVAEAALAELQRAFAPYPDLQYVVISNDAEQVRKSVNGAIEEIIIAVLFAILVVWLFFRDLRNTVVTIIGLPVIIIGTFAIIAAFGISINIMSLLAISVSVGLVIDDAIVVRENIFRYMERGYDPKTAASLGTAQVATSVLAMTLTLIAVFVPVTFTTGVTGIVFKAFGITVAVAMALSLVEAFTLAPMLSAYWFKQKSTTTRGAAPEGFLDETDEHSQPGLSERIYTRALTWSLRHRAATLLIAAVVIGGSVAVAAGLKFTFLPAPENHRIGLAFEMPPGTPLEVTNQRAREVEQILLSDPGVEAVVTTVGGQRGITGGGGDELAQFLVKLHDHTPSAEVRERLRPQLTDLPNLAMSLDSYQYGTNTSVQNRPILIKIRSTASAAEMAPIAEQIEAAVADVPGLADVGSTYNPGKPEVRFSIDQQRANDYGLTNRDLAITLRTLVDGNKAAIYREDGNEYDIVVRLRSEDRSNVETISQVRLPFGGQLIPLSSVTDLQLNESPNLVRRAERQNEILIGGNNVGRNVNDVQREMQARVAALDLPTGVDVRFGGASEDQNEGFASLLLAMALSVLFVYMVLASQFGSFSQPLVLMLAMPLSFIGAFLALRVANLQLDILAMIGLLMLLGLVVKNSILLIDFTNRLRATGMEKHAALIRAGATRLRPILMTSITIIAGNIPAALGIGEGAELRRGLGTAVIGGMITSTLLTLVIVPAAYSLLDGALNRMSHLRMPTINLRAARRQPTTSGPEASSEA
ncbi:MAG: efflux RND transporter permease subunit [Roseiflexaceae bacterium]